MTRIEYALLRDQEAHLRLPPWIELAAIDQEKVLGLDAITLIGLRTAKLLSREVGQFDYGMEPK